MSAEHDKRKMIKLTPGNLETLLKIRGSFSVTPSLSAVANRAIEIGAPELQSPSKPQPKKGK